MTSATGEELRAHEPATYRLVIRAKIVTDAPAPAVHWPPRRRAHVLIGAGIAAVLGLAWVGSNTFRTETSSTHTTTQGADELQSSLTTPLPDAAPAGSAAVGSSTDPQPVESNPATEPDAPPSPINQVMPAAARSALDTVRGTIRVVVRVTIDQQGAVLNARSHTPGPSRYFERISLEAARQWTFTPANTDAPRSMLLRFQFTREGVTAHAEPVQ